MRDQMDLRTHLMSKEFDYGTYLRKQSDEKVLGSTPTTLAAEIEAKCPRWSRPTTNFESYEKSPVKPAAETVEFGRTIRRNQLELIFDVAGTLELFTYHASTWSPSPNPFGVNGEYALNARDGKIRVRVLIDNGQDITPDFLPKIVDRFRERFNQRAEWIEKDLSEYQSSRASNISDAVVERIAEAKERKRIADQL